ncbi:PREDICTED: pre-mRNA-splicing factor SLU7-A-like [Fragaria vesca subsp. vesca]|uniref:pre-mRNA-splicing factor SLU7-A-like n=1 Tax=Fragaria vesca subsp. vesca TaxID=101020 RepID=UPI0002C32CF2|nr:PREDICTED: pre-mRNA-splicing factor SLU7-A-like [Fragaria vesca subsp. vesca]
MVSQNLASFKSRQEYRRNVELEEARKAGLVPAEVDKNGKEINPHIPKYVSDTPWYIKTDEGPSLEHQRKPESNVNGKKKSQYDSGAKVIQALKYREGACTNCGSMKHDAKSCIERPRKVGAKWNDKHIAPDEIVETLGHLTYDEKRDRWDGYNPSSYAHVLKRYELQQEARKKYLKEERIKKLEDQDVHHDDDMRVDEAKVDESKQTDFAKVEKRVRTAGGGSTGTVRNLRIREDTAKYLRNLDVNSAHYDPKSRSMRENPNPDADPNEQFYAGDNVWRNTGQALDFNQMNMHALEAFERGQDVHMQAAPSQAEFLYKNYKKIKERFTTQTNCTVLEKYGNAASGGELPKELLLGQSERVVEYDRAGRIIKGEEEAVPRSKYAEDVIINNHTCVWGSWWKGHRWGYKCCKQFMRNSYCTGAAGVEAAEAAIHLMEP